MGRRRGELRVGCSGFHYRHWKGDFYPRDLPQTQWFAHYGELTADWTYLRFHGRNCGGSDSPQALSGQARRIRRWLDEGRDVYAYFNNDIGGHAPRNAADLRRFVERD